jgi:hypothetical protein
MDLINKIKFWFQNIRRNPTQMNEKNTKELRELMHMLELTEEEEFSCDDVYKLLDQYVELVNAGEDAQELIPLIKKHLEICRDCSEEYEALLSIVIALPS